MITWRLNGEKKKIPGCYPELSTGTYQQVYKKWDGFKEPDLVKRDYFKLSCIISGSNFKDYELSTEQKVTLENTVSWFVDKPLVFNGDIPKVLAIGDKVLTIPKDIGSLSIGQNIFLRQQIEQSKYLEENISIAVATYLQTIYDNAKFDSDRVIELEKIIRELPITHTYQVGFFLLNRAWPNGRMLGIEWRQILSNLKQKSKRLLLTWLRLTDYRASMIYP
jgi:hypothetical protein